MGYLDHVKTIVTAYPALLKMEASIFGQAVKGAAASTGAKGIRGTVRVVNTVVPDQLDFSPSALKALADKSPAGRATLKTMIGQGEIGINALRSLVEVLPGGKSFLSTLDSPGEVAFRALDTANTLDGLSKNATEKYAAALTDFVFGAGSPGHPAYETGHSVAQLAEMAIKTPPGQVFTKIISRLISGQ